MTTLPNAYGNPVPATSVNGGRGVAAYGGFPFLADTSPSSGLSGYLPYIVIGAVLYFALK